jgi:hypothetical protein
MTPDNTEILATACIFQLRFIIIRGSIDADIRHLEFYNCVSRMMHDDFRHSPSTALNRCGGGVKLNGHSGCILVPDTGRMLRY